MMESANLRFIHSTAGDNSNLKYVCGFSVVIKPHDIFTALRCVSQIHENHFQGFLFFADLSSYVLGELFSILKTKNHIFYMDIYNRICILFHFYFAAF